MKKLTINSKQETVSVVFNLKMQSFVLFSVLCFLFTASAASAATLYIFPQYEDFYEGQTFSADVRLDTEGERINAAEIMINTDGELELVDFTTGSSIFSLIVGGPDINTEEGSVFMQAAEPGGFEGDVVVGTIVLQAKGTGEGSVSFYEDSKLAIADGEGTPAQVEFSGATYDIEERPDNLPTIRSKSHPVESEWSDGTFIRMEWEVKEGATYSYLLSRNPNDIPDEEPEEAVGDIKLSTNQQGIFYFHLRECVDGDPSDETAETSCGPVATRQVLLDVTKPEPFEIIAEEEQGSVFLSFSTKDNVSGIDYYEVFEGRHITKIKTPPYRLKDSNYEGKIIVKAYDKAGHVQQATISLPGEKIGYNKWLVVGIIVSVAGAAVFNFIWKRKQPNTKNV